jgi:prepilin-type N-terminal cleavage/methylation domain-containing protein
MTEAAMKAKKQFRGGMTLVELLVVIAIISLLAVSVSPLFQAGSERRRFTEAADVVSGHFNAVIARSIGRAAGDGAWLDATVGPAGAVTSLGFTRARNISGDITVTTVNPPTVTDPPYADVTFAPPLPLAPPAIAGLIHVAGYPIPYDLLSSTTIGLLPGYSLDNAAFPALNLSYKYQASITPQQRMTASSTQLKKGFCIDLSWSTIGVHNFTDPSEIRDLSAAGIGADILAVLFDGTGRVSSVWAHTSSGGGSWQWFLLDAQRPLALLIGESRRVGLPIETAPSEEAPGANIQSPDAVWIVIDPGSRIVRTIANNATPMLSSTSPIPRAQVTAHAQAFVLQALRNN